MRQKRWFVLLLLSAWGLAVLAAGERNPVCSSAAHHELDFWLGDWDVYNVRNELAAESRIEASLGGCVIQEHYRADSGYEGTSLNRYDARQGRWVQHWMDNVAGGIDFTGERDGDSMVFTATGLEDDDGLYRRRMQLIRVSADEVRQVSDRSYDQGDTWLPEYRLTYRRKRADTSAQ